MKNSPHKFADVIKAWADGEVVEYRYGPASPWLLYTSGFTGTPDFCDSCNTGIEWRRRPQPVVLFYRRCIIERFGQAHVEVCTSEIGAIDAEMNVQFIRWIDAEWQTVEL